MDSSALSGMSLCNINSVLVAEDDPLFRRLLLSKLQAWNYHVVVAEDGDKAWLALQQPDAPSLLLFDWMMPGMDGLELCRRVRQREDGPYPYILLLTANDTKEQIVNGLNAGADDYLTKPVNVDELRARLQVGRRILGLQNALHQKEQELRFAATHDALTNFWNRGALVEFLQRESARAARSQGPFSILMIDVDNFKKINDRYGHLTGDLVLKEVANRLSSVSRCTDWVGRYGGEEFMVIAAGCGGDALPMVSERLRESVGRHPVETPSGPVPVTVSVGALFVDSGAGSEDSDLLMRLADEALYRAKAAGRNRVELAWVGQDGRPLTPVPQSGAAGQLVSISSGR
jgi:diguanylate cyclase (GGDEF)-like protein